MENLVDACFGMVIVVVFLFVFLLFGFSALSSKTPEKNEVCNCRCCLMNYN